MANRRGRTPNSTVVAMIVCVSLAVVCLWQYASYTAVQVRVEFAREQVSVFEQMKRQAETGSPAEADEALAYVRSYYPSGTKQATGSKLDDVVETARRSAIAEIQRYVDSPADSTD